MPKKRPNSDDPLTPQTTDQEQAPVSGKTREMRPRVSIILDESGSKPDVSRMKQDTLDKLRTILSDPESMAALGMAGETPLASPETLAVADQFVDSFYSMLGKAEAAVFSFVVPPKIPWVITSQIFPFTEPEKAMLREPTKGSFIYLAKRFPWLTRVAECQDLVITATLIVVLSSTKLRMAREAYAQALAAHQAQQAPPSASSPLEVS